MDFAVELKDGLVSGSGVLPILQANRPARMKLVLLSVLLSASTLLSFAQDEEWEVYMAGYEKGPGSTLVNMSYKANAPFRQYPFLLIAGVTFPDCDSTGLPAKTAFDQLYAVSDQIQAILSNYKLAGTFTYQCERMDYYYLADTAGLRNKLEPVYKNFPRLQPILKIRTDTSWEAYLSFLYPNEETQEYMANEKILLHLVKEGDNLSQPRQVDHWLYFSSSADRDRFSAYIVTEKYKIENKQLVAEARLPYQLQISRVDKVDIGAITAITTSLRKKAEQYGGDYDGWETFVIK